MTKLNRNQPRSNMQLPIRRVLPSMAAMEKHFERTMTAEELITDAITMMVTDEDPPEKRPAIAYVARISELRYLDVPKVVLETVDAIRDKVLVPRHDQKRGIVWHQRRINRTQVEAVTKEILELLFQIRRDHAQAQNV